MNNTFDIKKFFRVIRYQFDIAGRVRLGREMSRIARLYGGVKLTNQSDWFDVTWDNKKIFSVDKSQKISPWKTFWTGFNDYPRWRSNLRSKPVYSINVMRQLPAGLLAVRNNFSQEETIKQLHALAAIDAPGDISYQSKNRKYPL